MPIIPLKDIRYEDFKDPRSFIDKIVENFNLLMYLLNNGLLDTTNINNDSIEGLPEVEWGGDFGEDLNPILDSFGIDPTYYKFHSNKVSNSSFERLNLDGEPLFWDISNGGSYSPDSNFDGSYTMKLEEGDIIIQQEENSTGLWSSAWWSWCGTTGHTRISFRAKGEIGEDAKITVSVLNGSDVAQPLTYWVYNSEADEKWTLTTGVTTIEFDVPPVWPISHKTFAVQPTVAGEMRIKFENTGDGDIYLDAVTAEPDYNGKWPSIYTDGPNSQRKIFVQDSEPSDANEGDIWIEIST